MALLVSVRLVYAPGQRAHLPAIHNIIFRNGAPGQRDASTLVRESWDSVLASRMIIHAPEGVFGPRDVLDAFLNGEFLHQDDDIQPALDAMRRMGAFTQVMLQSTTWMLGHVALMMDAVVADVLGEEHLVRNPPAI